MIRRFVLVVGVFLFWCIAVVQIIDSVGGLIRGFTSRHLNTKVLSRNMTCLKRRNLLSRVLGHVYTWSLQLVGRPTLRTWRCMTLVVSNFSGTCTRLDIIMDRGKACSHTQSLWHVAQEHL